MDSLQKPAQKDEIRLADRQGASKSNLKWFEQKNWLNNFSLLFLKISTSEIDPISY